MKRFASLVPFLFAVSATTLSAEWATVPAESTIGFTAFSRMHDVDGKFASWTFTGKIGDDWKGQGRITLRSDSVESGNAKRDTHLKNEDFFDVAGHPVISYDIDRAEVKGDHLLLTGKLTIRGVSRPVSLDLLRTVNGSRAELSGETLIKRQDYGMTYSSMINPIKDEVKLKFRVVLVHK